MTTQPHASGVIVDFVSKKDQTIEQAWQDYRAAVYVNMNMLPEHELEVRQAFIGGVAWTLGCLFYMPDQEQGVAFLTRLEKEVEAFSQDTRERAAARQPQR